MKKLTSVSDISLVILAGLFLSLLFGCKKEATNVIPSIVIATVGNITESSAATGGEISSDGGSAVTARGVCWNTDKIPTTSDKKTTDGNGLGSFTSSITGLTAGGTYYVRAYATNAVGTAYSSQVTFSALSTVPILTTTSLSDVATTSAKTGGNIVADGGSAISARGVCWGTTSNPTTANNITTDGTGNGLFVSSISGLAVNTLYYIRAYATNSKGTTYGEQIVLKTFTGTVTDVDANTYNTVTIGSQVWMAENLKTTKYSDGSEIPVVTDAPAWAALTTGACCWYNNDKAASNPAYGALYNWYAVSTSTNGGKNVCPTGWHVPSDGELTSLTSYLGGDIGAGGKLKEAGTAHWLSPNTGATNETGFTALPGGNRGDVDFLGIYNGGNLWSSTDYVGGSSWNRYFNASNSNVHTQFSGKENGFSVRCLKD